MHIHKSQLPDLTLIDVIISRSLPVCAGRPEEASARRRRRQEKETSNLSEPVVVGAQRAVSGSPFRAAKVPITARDEAGESPESWETAPSRLQRCELTCRQNHKSKEKIQHYFHDQASDHALKYPHKSFTLADAPAVVFLRELKLIYSHKNRRMWPGF